MTLDEFHEWFREHCSRFTGIRPWLDKTIRGPNAPTEAQILRSWCGVLRDVDLEAALTASQRMHSGEIEEPKGFDRHPAAIRRACGVSRRASSSGPRFDADGNQTFACLNCRDDGYVTCWSDKSMKAMRDGTFGQPFTVYSTAVVCHCPAGRTHDRRNDWPRFDPKRMLLILVATWDDGDRERLEKFVEGMRPSNYNPAFAEFA